MLGLPFVVGYRRYAVAMAADSLGTGMFFPVSLLYFVHATDLHVAEIGAGLAVATAASLPTGLAFGALVDRWGARNVVILSNVVHAVAFIGYGVVDSWMSLVALMFVAQAGDRAFYAAYAPLTTQVSTPDNRRQWFGLLAAMRNAGMALGAVLAGVGLGVAGDTAFEVIVLLNAATFALAAVLLVGLRPPPLPVMPPPTEPVFGSWRVVLKDRAYLALCLLNVCFALPSNALTLVLPLYLVQDLGMPSWTVGLGFALNCVLSATLQNPVVGRFPHWSHVKMLRTAAAASAASALIFLAARLQGGAWVCLVLGVLVFTAGELLEGPAMSTLSSEAAPHRLRGRYLSVFQLSWSVANSAGTAVVTALMGLDFGLAWVALAILSGLGGAFITPIGRRLVPHHELDDAQPTSVGRAER